jgi:hypothetical protein
MRLQKALASLASIGHAELRDAAKRHARLALARAENVMELPEDLEIVRKLARFSEHFDGMTTEQRVDGADRHGG